MNVAELIEALHVYDPDMEVSIWDDEEGELMNLDALRIYTHPRNGHQTVELHGSEVWEPWRDLRPVFGPPAPKGHRAGKILEETAKQFGITFDEVPSFQEYLKATAHLPTSGEMLAEYQRPMSEAVERERQKKAAEYKPLFGFVGVDENGRDLSVPPSPLTVWREPETDS